ncbi:MBL fold metallo-hydrolase [Cyclobacterium jeungdonense]|uniref:MBL fold metallo-hydrolase n=1 Tax=Cyclobacterium jeungdonense TaxID=708087 RepID=A0ABT8C468_9BACT|nr:MBL fold metallo-hydrolase [Cyclobacterium jeungdonense]MDN3686550.1 MBL fold metallo-hydrolase [Cyclobacterium jeungdonense]
MYTIKTLDLHFQKEGHTIASFLISDQNHRVLVETGPESTWPQLVSELRKHQLSPGDIDAVLLTHIHFDHAGAAWRLAAAGAKIYVHPLGLPHLASPEKLWRSAAKIYGEANMGKLWGNMYPIDNQNLIPTADLKAVAIGKMTFIPLHTPGHAVHHVAWKLGKNIFTGDVAGVKINDGPVVPPCPPPDVHLEDWRESMDKILAQKPDKLYLTHYGMVTNPAQHFEQLKVLLNDWAEWMKIRFQEEIPEEIIIQEFTSYTGNQMADCGANQSLRQLYELANPSWMSVSGLLRYWKLKKLGII